MRRPLLLTLAALGGLISLVGGAGGMFAALSDTASTGTNSVSSAPLAASADLQLATASSIGGAVECGTFSENLTTAVFTVSDMAAPSMSGRGLLCVRNVGSRTVTLSALASELLDTDVACTGDEEVSGDTTCGGNQAGEMSPLLDNYLYPIACATASGSGGSATLASMATTPRALGTVSPGTTVCLYTEIFYAYSATDVQKQTAQSDRVTWRYAFTGQV